MRIKNILNKKQIKSEILTINFLDSGDIYDITSNDYLINLLRGNLLDGSVANLYLKVFNESGNKTTPLIGVKSPSQFDIVGDTAIYSGVFNGVEYQVALILESSTWFYQISYSSFENKDVQFYYGQDVAINHISSVLSSEPYTVQYIDYKVFEDDNGYKLCARQNQGKTQFLQIGSTSKTIGYTTDGFQFFGKEYKYTNVPKAYNQNILDSEIYQYEFSYLALQTEVLKSSVKEKHVMFYGHYDPEYTGTIEKAKQIDICDYIDLQKPTSKQHKKGILQTNMVLNGKQIDEAFLNDNFNEIRHKEYNDNELISFFTDNHHHVVTQQKELLVERPHGHLMIHGEIESATENVMATTNFMFGVFNSHIVLGNTTFNKFLGDVRNPLNLLKISGQRIYIKENGTYKILGIPSYYEMGATSTTWVYKLEDDTLKITSFVDVNDTVQRLEFSSKKQYEIIVTHQIIMGTEENLYDIEYKKDSDIFTFSPPPHSMMKNEYPNLTYQMKVDGKYKVVNDLEIFGYEANSGMLTFSFESTNKLSIGIRADLNGPKQIPEVLNFSTLDDKGTKYFKNFLKGLEIKTDNPEMSKILDVIFWYTHNALVHYSSPHGLEQYNGAAWGTRDVCQGPAELFMASQRFDLVRDILLKVYSRQFLENGDFPQWFMYDKYYKIQAHESHGDIIIWPLRLLGTYLKQTGDLSILDEKVKYMSLDKNDFTFEDSLFNHVKHQIKYIKKSFIKGTNLPKYGGGDWDDTLQPANHELKENMVSGWTVALLFETLNIFTEEIKKFNFEFYGELSQMKNQVRVDYEKYMLKDDLPAGFVVFNGEPSLLIHPTDKQTGIKYRLLPYLRSMISSLASQEQTKTFEKIIDENLKHPDGVRLMDKTVTYKDGKQTFFQRAETAANFGREIGLQYVHAHIRYIEAMFNIGASQKAYSGLLEINPINIQQTVNNAMLRQSNMYFSSSDANFKTRHEAQENWTKIKSGEIQVKGGWRLYSSGPGIYINQVISNLIGISQLKDKLLIDPSAYDITKINQIKYRFHNQNIIVNILKGEPRLFIETKNVKHEKLYNKYRFKGYLIDLSNIAKESTIEMDLWIK